MIRRAEEMLKDIKDQLRGGKGSVEFTHLFNQEEMAGKGKLCAKLKLSPGASIGFHSHIDEEEIYYILKGKGLVDDNGKKQEVQFGDAVITGGGDSHSIENTGEGELEFLAVIIPF